MRKDRPETTKPSNIALFPLRFIKDTDSFIETIEADGWQVISHDKHFILATERIIDFRTTPEKVSLPGR